MNKPKVILNKRKSLTNATMNKNLMTSTIKSSTNLKKINNPPPINTLYQPSATSRMAYGTTPNSSNSLPNTHGTTSPSSTSLLADNPSEWPTET
jgi:hypothetical protein